jgi:hypothetical protein
MAVALTVFLSSYLIFYYIEMKNKTENPRKITEKERLLKLEIRKLELEIKLHYLRNPEYTTTVSCTNTDCAGGASRFSDLWWSYS